MKHYLEEDLFEYIDGACDKESEAVITAHLDNCPQCARLYQELSVLDKELQQLPAGQPSPHFTATVISRLYPAPREEAGMSFIFIGQPLMFVGIAAALLILLISAVSLGLLDATLINEYPIVSEWTGFPAFLEILSKGLSGLCVLVMLVVLDKAVLSPYFKKRKEKITLSR